MQLRGAGGSGDEDDDGFELICANDGADRRTGGAGVVSLQFDEQESLKLLTKVSELRPEVRCGGVHACETAVVLCSQKVHCQCVNGEGCF